MKLIKILAEEFPMFNQFSDPDAGMHGENPTGDDLSSTEFDSLEGNPEEKEECVCTCDCPCCSANREKENNSDDLAVDFSAQETGANLKNPEDEDDTFTFEF